MSQMRTIQNCLNIFQKRINNKLKKKALNPMEIKMMIWQ